MAVGLPIIATNVRGNRDLVKHGENGFLVHLNNIEQTARTIMYLIESEELRTSMSEKSKDLVKLYDLENIVTQMRKIYSFFL